MTAFNDLPLELTSPYVSSYLGAAGWQLVIADDFSQTWQLGQGPLPEARLRLPTDTGLDDYSIRFEEALQRLCRVNNWSLQQLATQVLGARSDFMYIRADQSSIDGTIPLRQAEALLQGADALLYAAASSAVRPKAQHLGKRPELAKDFIRDDVRMGHTQRGSFIITIVTRLDEDEVVHVDAEDHQILEVLEPGRLSKPVQAGNGANPSEIVLPPFQRRVMSTLATGVESARSMALHSGDQTMEDAVARGLSANLVAALGAMTDFEGLRALDLSFSWAIAEKAAPPPSVGEVIVDRDVIAELRPLRERLERRPAEPEVETIYGQVTRLERGERDQTGVVTVNV